MQRSEDDEGIAGEATDVSLMLQVRATSDTEAFALLAGRYRPQLRRFFAALLPSGAPADDFAQETLLRLWLARDRYEPTGKFSAYLFQIARHYYLNQRMSYRARQTLEVSVDSAANSAACGDLPDTADSGPELTLLREVERARIRQAIADLPPHYQTVFVLSHFEGLKYAAIAERLGIPIGTVKSRMSEAVRRLRKSLTQED